MKRKESLFKYIIVVLFVAMLFLTMLPKKVKAVGYGLLGEVGMQVSNTDITKVNLNLKNNITYSSNLSPWFSNGEGTGVERNIELNTLYEITATNAFTYLGQPLNLKISFKPTYINNRCFLKISNGKTSNLELVLANFDSIVEITYTITNSSGQVVDYDFCYGFGDPDGGDYLFENVENADIYYTPSAATAGNLAFANAFNITSDGIIIRSSQCGFQSDGFIYISNNTETSTFSMRWSTVSDSNRPNMYDYLVLPGLYYEPIRLDIKMNMNGGFLLPTHGSTIGTSGEYVTVNNSSTIHSIKMNETLSNFGLCDYNNPEYINLAKLGHYVEEGSEFFAYGENNNIEYYDQLTQYAASDFVSDTTHSAIKELFVNWKANNYIISYVSNGGTLGSNSPTTYQITSPNITISNPTKTGYTFGGWKKTVNSLDWEYHFLNSETGESETNSSYPKAYHTGYISLKAGNTYTISGYGSYNANGIRWRIYDTSGNYLGATTGGTVEGNTCTPTTDCYAKILFINESTDAQRSGVSISNSGVELPVIIPTGSEGKITLTAQWIPNTTITIRKDNSNWTTNNNIVVELRSSTNTYSDGTRNGATVTWTAVTAGTYNIYASKNANNLTTLVDTGIDVTVSGTGTAAIDYYTLTLNKGVGISAVSGAGTYLKNQVANIDATVSAGYTWQGWSVVSGNSPN